MYGESLAATPPPTASGTSASSSTEAPHPVLPHTSGGLTSLEISSSAGSSVPSPTQSLQSPSRLAMLAPTPLAAGVEEVSWSPHEWKDSGHWEELDEWLAHAHDGMHYTCEENQDLQVGPGSPSSSSVPLCAASLETLASLSAEDTSTSAGSRPPRPRRRPGAMDCLSSPPTMGGEGGLGLEDHVLDTPSVRRPRCLNLATPSSASSMSYKRLLTPGTPQPERCDLNLISGDVGAVFFDFDGTLTASPGDRAQRCRKQVELRERAPLLAPRLKALREAGMVLAIISKSSEATIIGALECAGLKDFFDGPVIGKAIGLEGKAGYIEDLCCRGCLHHIGMQQRALLVDDDVRELDRARLKGIQTYPAPKEGGLQEEDFDEMFAGLGMGDGVKSLSTASANSRKSLTIPSTPSGSSAPTLFARCSSSQSPSKRASLVPELPELPELDSRETMDEISPKQGTVPDLPELPELKDLDKYS